MNCDRIAPWYRWLEYLGFGTGLERRRFAFLGRVADAHRILILGEGDGRFLKRLARRNPQANIDCVDSSAAMLKLARSRTAGARVAFHHADARTLPLPSGEYDLIVTHFFLDCFDPQDAQALVSRISCAASRQARWLVSEFRQPERGWRAAWAWLWLRALYSFFNVATGLRTKKLVDHHPLLVRSGFRLEYAEASRFGLLSSELWSRVRQ